MLAFSMNSCSSDDNSDSNSGTPGGTITAKINGVSKTFNKVVVNQETFTEDGETYTELIVTGTIGNSTDEVISFDLDAGDLGAQAIYAFSYKSGSNAYYYNGQVFNTVVQTNSNNKLVGNFSGNLGNNDGSVTFADGAFDITY